MVDLNDIRDIINADLSAVAGTAYDIDIGTEYVDYNNLPQEKKGYYKQDKSVPAIISTISGFYQAIPGLDLYQGIYRLSFLVSKRQLNAFMAMLGDYIKAKNGVAFYSTDYTIVPTFDLVIPGSASTIQGVTRIKVSVDVVMAVTYKGISLNDLEVSLDGSQLLLLSYTMNMAKGIDSFVKNNDGGTTKGKILSKSLTFEFSIIYTNSTICKSIMDEILNVDGTKLDTVHTLIYWDIARGTTTVGEVTTKNTSTFSVIIQTATPTYILGQPSRLTVTATLAH